MSDTISPSVTIAPPVRLIPQEGLSTGPAGKSVVIRGPFDIGEKYYVLDLVTDEGQTYICIKYSDGNEITDEEFFILAAAKGDPFIFADFTPEQLALLKGDKGDAFVYSDFTPEQLALLKGDKGDPGTTDYNNLENKPTIPTDISNLNDDTGIINNLTNLIYAAL